jgi:hypothetical protein
MEVENERLIFDNSLGFNHISAKLDAIDQNQVQDTDWFLKSPRKIIYFF